MFRAGTWLPVLVQGRLQTRVCVCVCMEVCRCVFEGWYVGGLMSKEQHRWGVLIPLIIIQSVACQGIYRGLNQLILSICISSSPFHEAPDWTLSSPRLFVCLLLNSNTKESSRE